VWLLQLSVWLLLLLLVVVVVVNVGELRGASGKGPKAIHIRTVALHGETPHNKLQWIEEGLGEKFWEPIRGLKKGAGRRTPSRTGSKRPQQRLSTAHHGSTRVRSQRKRAHRKRNGSRASLEPLWSLVDSTKRAKCTFPPAPEMLA